MRLSLKLSLLTSFVGVVFVLLIFSNTYKQISKNAQESIIQKYQDDLADLTNSLNLLLNKATEVISLSTIMRKEIVEKSPAILHKRFEIYMKTIPQISKMSFITLDGKELVKTSRDRLFQDSYDKFYMNEEILNVVMQDKIYYSDIYFTKESNEMMIDIFKASKDLISQDIIGIITIQVSMGEIQELISNKLINGNGIGLLNVHNNQYLYKSSTIDQISEELEKISKLQLISNITKKDKQYIAIKREYSFQGLKMGIVIANSNDNIFSKINDTFIKNIQLLLFVIIVLAIVMFLFVNYLLKPLRNLQKEIQYLSKKISPGEGFSESKNTNELEMIRENFYFFVKVITKKREQLEEYNKNLQLKVDEEVQKNKEKEKLLAHQVKMASMGEMLENIAHQWRQPLSVISTSASGLVMQKKFGLISEEEEIERLDKITEVTEYLSETITSFRNFFQQEKQKRDCNLKNICLSTLRIIESKFVSKEIEIITNIEDIKLHTYDSELTQVLMNIFNNANDVLVQCKHRKIIFIDIHKIDENAIITIKDNGGGIPEDIIDKVFEPYFTTKFKSNGTGIGLYMSQEIVTKSLNGTINVKNEIFSYENKEYKGATFIITMPIVP